MIAYPDGTAQFLTVGQMYDQRALCKNPGKTGGSEDKCKARGGKAGGEKNRRKRPWLKNGPNLLQKPSRGGGSGTMPSGRESLKLRERRGDDSLPGVRRKKFVLLDVVRRGLLRFDEE